ncbi:MAG: DUF418 domain-containing protein [Wenzhouxiangella sp.]
MTSTVQTELLARAPAPASNRLVAVDMLRGLAVLGLMMVHIFVFSQPMDSVDPRYGLDYTGANAPFIWIQAVLGVGNFIFLFSMLFGASVLFFDGKHDEPGLKAGAWLWYQRMFWLAVIGGLHGVLLFFGDILLSYALCGMLGLWWLRKLSARHLMWIGVGAYVLGLIGYLLMGLLMAFLETSEPEMMAEFSQMMVDGHAGSFLEGVRFRIIHIAQMMMMFPFVVFWGLAGAMLIGLSLAKQGVLTGERSTRFYLRLSVVSLAIGLPLSVATFAWLQSGEFSSYRSAAWFSLNMLWSVPMALGYLGLVMLMARFSVFKPVQAALAAVGRMAMSNYLLHSVIGAVIFHGWALGYYQRLEFPGLAWIVLGTWAFNVLFSLVWLHFFRFGPAEWLWRSLTYWKRQPLLKRA